MSNATDEQPAPQATDRAPIWPMVIAYVERNYVDDVETGATSVARLADDMRARHEVGIKRYGVPLTSGNGRDSMVDAYQELLDFCVYARTWLDEHGIDVLAPQVAVKASAGLVVDPDGKGATVTDQAAFAESPDLTPVERMMVNMFSAATEALLSLRGAMS